MADLLLNKVINEEIPSKLLIQWLTSELPETNEDFTDIRSCNVGQIDFVTYFLNFIHEEGPCNSNLTDTPQKLNTPKRIDKVQNHNATESSTAKTPRTNLFASQNSSFNNSLNKTSTPNISRPLDSCFSPISPLYDNQNQAYFNSNEVRQNSGSKKSSVCLGDFIITTSKNSSKKKKKNAELLDFKKEASRRIKPTSIYAEDNGFPRTDNSFNFKDDAKEVPVGTSTEQRNLLVAERLKIISTAENSSTLKLCKRQTEASKCEVKPLLHLVTYRHNLNHVVDVYRTILDRKLALNITSEIFFLVSLSLSNQAKSGKTSSVSLPESNDYSNLGVEFLDSSASSLSLVEGGGAKSHLCNSEIFESVHNVVYFAIKCLETQLKTIQLYDRPTIKLMAENERVREFSPFLFKKVVGLYEKKTDKPGGEVHTSSPQANVCFNIDTDNKEHFPDLVSFHTFRKQRDLFYEILRIWEVNHLTAEWDFPQRLGAKVKNLFHFNCGPANYMHLARLFKNQLLSSCAKGPKEKGLSEKNISLLPPLAIDADKFNRLTKRLVTKQASSGINSLPVFSGHQEFFKEFIEVSSDYCFTKHLSDCLVSDIIELNEAKFSGIEEEGEGPEVDQNTRQLYVNSIKNLRILAKFLGFIESLAYRLDSPNLSKNVLEAQIKIRQQFTPPLNIISLLRFAIEKRTIVLIVPWLVKYLAMLDYVALRLPYYSKVFQILFELYQNYDISGASLYNAALVKYCLGWLFELPHFPDGAYFEFCSKKPAKPQISNGISANLNCLDCLDIVNQGALYFCCPYLEEIKRILSTNASGSRVNVKYITPVTALESSTEMTRKKLEQQLEEAFFSGQPTSVRKTVEFISERVASAAVKFICHDAVPKAKEAAVKDLKENVLKIEDCENCDDIQERKAQLKKRAGALAQIHLKNFEKKCKEEILKLSQQRIPPAVESLLAVDVLKETRDVCIEIANKMCTDRVGHWINSHVNPTMFSKDFDSEIQKFVNGRRNEKEKIPFILPPGGRNCSHNENALNGFHALDNIRETCCQLAENRELSLQHVQNLLKETLKTLTQRNDVNDMISATISTTLFDLCLLLISHSPAKFFKSDNLINDFLGVWALYPKGNASFKALFCPRNVKILKQFGSKGHETWDVYARLITRLLNEKLIEQEDVECQCMGFYNTDRDEETLGGFSHFLKKLVACSNCDGTDKFSYLLDFLSDFCSDL